MIDNKNIIIGENLVDFIIFNYKGLWSQKLPYKGFFRILFSTVTNLDLDWHKHNVLRRVTVLNNIEEGEWVFFDEDIIPTYLVQGKTFWVYKESLHRLFLPKEKSTTNLSLLVEEYDTLITI